MSEHSTRIRTGLLVGLVIACSSCTAPAQHTITFDSGTQYTADAGNTFIVFDLQGVLWRMPAAGGSATALTSLKQDMRRPRLSPDGQWIAFQSFERGSWNIGTMRIDGSRKRLLTAATPGALTPLADNRDPEWSTDGRTIWFASDRSGNYDLWSIAIDGTGLRQHTTDPADDYFPSLSARGLAFVSERNGAPALHYSETGNPETGAVEIARSPAGRLHPPRISPDGDRIAYVQAIQRNGFPGIAVNQLVVHDLATETKQVVSADGADVFAAAPAWAENDTLLYTADGGIQRASLPNGRSQDVPFTAAVSVTRSRFRPRTPLAFRAGKEAVRGIVDPVLLADDRIVFNALGDLWAQAKDGALEQLTDDAFVERDPDVSADGNFLTYISDRGGDMQIWLHDLRNGSMRQLTNRSSGPRYPTFSPNGMQVAYQQVGPIGTQDFSVRILDIQSGKSRRLRSAPGIWPGRMGWSADGAHLSLAAMAIPSKRFNDGANRLLRINVANDVMTVDPLPNNRTPDFGPVTSPDGLHMALVVDGALYRIRTRPNGSLTGPLTLVLDELVESPVFSADSRRLGVLTQRGLETVNIETGQRRVRNPDLAWTPATNSGMRIVHAGRVFDGESERYLQNVDIVINGARITSVEPHRDHPPGVEVIDAGQRTVLPGLIDHHAHHEPHKGEWVGRAWLGFGVTTVVEPGGLPYESREHLESWLSGRRQGPRLVYAGPQLDGDRRHFYFGAHINSARRLDWELLRAERLDYGLLKTYTRLPPDLQQRAVTRAHALGLPVTAHAAFRNLAFGGDRIEHLRGSSRLAYSAKQSDLLNSYADIQNLLVASKASVTPTLVVAGGWFDYALKYPTIFDNRQFVALNPQAYRQGLAGFTRMTSKNIDLIRRGLRNAEAHIKWLHDNGVRIVAGTDSPIFPYGLALIVELSAYVDAGLTPAAAIRTATAHAADAMGAAQHVGRVQPGLLADLLIVDGDPLSDVSELLDVSGVLLNGRYHSLDRLLQKP